MSQKEKVKILEKRLINTERALLALWSLLEDTMPANKTISIDNMMQEFFEANTDLGANFAISSVDGAFVK